MDRVEKFGYVLSGVGEDDLGPSGLAHQAEGGKQGRSENDLRDRSDSPSPLAGKSRNDDKGPLGRTW
jgi:hypothetical protein